MATFVTLQHKISSITYLFLLFFNQLAFLTKTAQTIILGHITTLITEICSYFFINLILFRRGNSLQPLIFWDRCPNHLDLEEGHCFLFDKEMKGSFSFKAVGYPCSCEASESNEYAELAGFLEKMKNEDLKLEFVETGFLEEVDI